MSTWEQRVVIAATLLLGCQGNLEGNAPNGSTPGLGGSGGPGLGGGGTTAGPGTGAQGDPKVCVPGVPGTSQLPRLTRVQYDNTIRDLLGLTSQPSTMLAPDTLGSVDQRAWDGYKLAAETLSAAALSDSTARAKAIPCTPSGDGAACAHQLVTEFGARAFRRPLKPEEVTRFEALFTNRAQLTASGSFEEAAQLIIEGFLKSPSCRLSFGAWALLVGSSMPRSRAGAPPNRSASGPTNPMLPPEPIATGSWPNPSRMAARAASNAGPFGSVIHQLEPAPSCDTFTSTPHGASAVRNARSCLTTSD